jgi:hypothetical protein
LPEPGIFSGQIQKVVHQSKLGFPKSDLALTGIPLDHGLESHVTKRRGIAHGHLAGVTAQPQLGGPIKKSSAALRHFLNSTIPAAILLQ